MLDGIRWLFAPVIAWWSFFAVAPTLIYIGIAMFAVAILVQILRLFFGK